MLSTNLSKLASSVAACTALGIGAYYITDVLKTHIRAVHAQNTMPAMTVNYVSHFLSGKEIRSFVAVRSNGDIVEGKFLTQPDGNEYGMRGIALSSAGKLINVLDDIKATHTARLNGGLNHDDPATSCTTPVVGKLAFTKRVLDTEIILGQPVVHVQWQLKNDVVDRWEAPHWDCLVLKDVLTQNGAVAVNREASNIIPGDPDPNLFLAPADYTEMSPSAADAVFAAKFLRGDSPACIRRTQVGRDANYYRTHVTP